MKQPDTNTAIAIAKGMLSLGFLMAAGFYAYSQFRDDKPKHTDTPPPATMPAPPPANTPTAKPPVTTAPTAPTAPSPNQGQGQSQSQSYNDADRCILNVLEQTLLPKIEDTADILRKEDKSHLRNQVPQIVMRFTYNAKTYFAECEEKTGVKRSAASDKTLERLERTTIAFEQEFTPKPQ